MRVRLQSSKPEARPVLLHMHNQHVTVAVRDTAFPFSVASDWEYSFSLGHLPKVSSVEIDDLEDKILGTGLNS